MKKSDEAAQTLIAAERKVALRNFVSREIKWTEELEAHLDSGTRLHFEANKIRPILYRPFVAVKTYYSRVYTHRTYQQDKIFPIEGNWDNLVICFAIGGRLHFTVFATNIVPNLTIFSLDANQCLSRHTYDKKGICHDNITDWSLSQFQTHYADSTITKDAIFNYVYAILHDPLYRGQYAQNLKRDFPHIPFYSDFWHWATWGSELINLHVNYTQVPPFALQRIDTPVATPKCILRADPTAGRIIIDSATSLTGVPSIVWDYTLGNRSAIDWVLDQYKEKTPKDSTIREKFATYHFKDHKQQVIDLLLRVTTVSVETMRIVEAMRICSH